MCGLAGFVGIGDRTDLEKMAHAIRHRGPDGDGFYHDPERRLHLAHRRLAIIDIEGGDQPMQTTDGKLVIVFNGEIYNHVALRQELESLGHRFVTDHSDTEVLLHGWRQWGRDLPEKLDGMFAFVLYDVDEGKLFLARDRFGEKPLFWGRSDGLLAFASELTAITAHSQFHVELDRLALKKYFAYGYIPAPTAIYRGCRKLPAGHWLELDLKRDDVTEHCYWSYEIAPEETTRPEQDLAEELFALIEASVSRRMMSDVPLGIFLSGGMDSSAILAAARSKAPDALLKSFSIGFEDASFDESGYARIVADQFASQHHVNILDVDSAIELLDHVLGQLDEPMSDPSILPTYLLSQFTRQHVTVALSGDGGDELFAGYDPFKALKPAALYTALMPRAGHKSIRRLADLLPKSSRNMSFDFKLRRFLQGLSHKAPYWSPMWMAPFSLSDMEDLFHETADADELYSEAIAVWNRDDKLDLLDRSLEFFARFYLQDDILVKVDRAAMLNGLESRAVFLDPEIAAFSAKLPNRYKLRGSQQKYILHEALSQHLPREILDRKKKGFGIPLRDWLKQIPIDTHAAPTLGIDQAFLDRQVETHRTDRADHRLGLWSYVVATHTLQRRA